jgi:uncharacterized protein
MAMTIIEQPSIVAGKRPHEACYSAWLSWSQQKMGVVAHQQIGVLCATITRLCFAKVLRVLRPILVVRKARQAVVAALNNVLRDTAKVESREPDHVVSIPASRRLRRGKITFGPAVKRLAATPKVFWKAFLTPSLHDMSLLSHTCDMPKLSLRWGLLAVVACGWLGASTTRAAVPSFVCGPNNTVVEKAICADGELADLDAQLASIYQDMVEQSVTYQQKLDPSTAGQSKDLATVRQAIIRVRHEQREWLTIRDAVCGQAQGSECLRKRYRQRIAALVDESTQLGFTYPLSRLRTGETAWLTSTDEPVNMQCGKDVVNLNFSDDDTSSTDKNSGKDPSLADGRDAETGSVSDTNKSPQVVERGKSGVLEASFADCRFSSGTTIRVKTGLEQQSQAYGQCGAAPPARFSVWVDQRKVISSIEFASNGPDCQHSELTKLMIDEQKATFCLTRDPESKSNEPIAHDSRLVPTRGLCGDLAFSSPNLPDRKEYPPPGASRLTAGSLSLQAAVPFKSLCERISPNEDHHLPKDLGQPDWKVVPDMYQLSTATFDLINSGTPNVVYMTNQDSPPLDGSALTTHGSKILKEFNPQDAQAAINKELEGANAPHVKSAYTYVYNAHADVFFYLGKTYILLIPSNSEDDPTVITLNEKSTRTVCTFHRAQEDF